VRGSGELAIQIAPVEELRPMVQWELAGIVNYDTAGVNDDALYARALPILAPPRDVISHRIAFRDVGLSPAAGPPEPRHPRIGLCGSRRSARSAGLEEIAPGHVFIMPPLFETRRAGARAGTPRARWLRRNDVLSSPRVADGGHEFRSARGDAKPIQHNNPRPKIRAFTLDSIVLMHTSKCLVVSSAMAAYMIFNCQIYVLTLTNKLTYCEFTVLLLLEKLP
jgi:hypothetical protein